MRSMTRRYNEATGIPRDLDTPKPGTRLAWSRHAQEEAIKDCRRLGIKMPVPPRVLPSCTLVETITFAGRAARWLVRFPWTNQYDLVLAFNYDGYVKTCWLQAKDDNHATLVRERYDRAGDL